MRDLTIKTWAGLAPVCRDLVQCHSSSVTPTMFVITQVETTNPIGSPPTNPCPWCQSATQNWGDSSVVVWSAMPQLMSSLSTVRKCLSLSVPLAGRDSGLVTVLLCIPVPVQAVGDSPCPALEAVWKTSGPHPSLSATAVAVPATSMPTSTASGWLPLIRARTSLQLRFKKHWRLATRGRECLDARSAWRPQDLNSQYKLSNKF